MFTIVVDPCPMFRRGLQHSLSHTKFRAGMNAATMDDIPEDVICSKATLCVIGMDDEWRQLLESVRRVHALNPALPIATLYTRYSPAQILTVLDAGAKAVLTKDVSCEAFVNYLTLISLGETIVPASVMRQVPEPIAQCADTVKADAIHAAHVNGVEHPASIVNGVPSRLSNREEAILRQLLLGASNKVIARQLQVSEATVKVHVKAVFRKIRVKNRTQAAMWASQCLGTAADTTNDSAVPQETGDA